MGLLIEGFGRREAAARCGNARGAAEPGTRAGGDGGGAVIGARRGSRPQAPSLSRHSVSLCCRACD
jgi:hypothetical protein